MGYSKQIPNFFQAASKPLEIPNYFSRWSIVNSLLGSRF